MHALAHIEVHILHIPLSAYQLAHFLVVRMTFTLEDFYRLYILEIVRLHGLPVFIVSDRDPRFIAHFWKSFQRVIGTVDDEHCFSLCSGSTLHIRLMWWIGASLLSMRMEPSRRDWYISWIARNKFCDARP